MCEHQVSTSEKDSRPGSPVWSWSQLPSVSGIRVYNAPCNLELMTTFLRHTNVAVSDIQDYRTLQRHTVPHDLLEFSSINRPTPIPQRTT
ncbi:hypothetical protein SLA2020_337730 [Shorea laevis]